MSKAKATRPGALGAKLTAPPAAERSATRQASARGKAKALQPRKASPGRATATKRTAPAPLPVPEEQARIVVFSCQWAPHYAFQSLYRRGVRGEGTGVRVLTACVGRVGEDLVLEAFRRGAAGVAVLRCPADICRHGLDHAKFEARVASLRTILAALGIGEERLLVGAFHPHEGERLAETLGSFGAAAHAAAGEALG